MTTGTVPTVPSLFLSLQLLLLLSLFQQQWLAVLLCCYGYHCSSCQCSYCFSVSTVACCPTISTVSLSQLQWQQCPAASHFLPACSTEPKTAPTARSLSQSCNLGMTTKMANVRNIMTNIVEDYWNDVLPKTHTLPYHPEVLKLTKNSRQEL